MSVTLFCAHCDAPLRIIRPTTQIGKEVCCVECNRRYLFKARDVERGAPLYYLEPIAAKDARLS